LQGHHHPSGIAMNGSRPRAWARSTNYVSMYSSINIYRGSGGTSCFLRGGRSWPMPDHFRRCILKSWIPYWTSPGGEALSGLGRSSARPDQMLGFILRADYRAG
jgi:hypothetical protein